MKVCPHGVALNTMCTKCSDVHSPITHCNHGIPHEEECAQCLYMNPYAGKTEKAQRFNEGKPQLSLVLEFRRALEGASYGLEEGVGKYGRGDWRKGMPKTDVADSLARHLVAYLSGELIDPTSNKPHVDKILCNALMLSEYEHEDSDKQP